MRWPIAPLATPLASWIREISNQDFLGYQRLVYRETGIHLGLGKKALLVGRIARRIHELGGLSYRDYLRRATEDAAERAQLIEAICTHETRFFREPRQFELLEREVLPRWRKQGASGAGTRKVRAWSAGCSSGEEPFSLAMVLRHALPAAEGWEIEILATDISRRILDRARDATWPIAKAEAIPRRYLEAFMLRGTGIQEGRMRAGPELRGLVHFDQVNLNEACMPAGRFDLILCRNVFIYFDAASRARVVEALLDRLAPEGYLFLGQVESLGGLPRGIRAVAPATYMRAA